MLNKLIKCCLVSLVMACFSSTSLGDDNLSIDQVMVKADQFYSQQDYPQAMQWYVKAADKGNALGMYNIGIMYREGLGVKQDYSQMMQWYLKAADKGNTKAMYDIGVMYREGRGVKQDYSQMMQWYLKAADKGNAEAMYNIGVIYGEGKRVKQDYQQAIQWFLKAADKGNALAMNNIGVMYREGLGVQQDYQQAMQWYLKAANKGNALGMYNVGVMYGEGLGVKQDYQQAIQWFLKAADKGNALAMNNIGVMYNKGQGVKQDYSQAMQWFLKAADKGYAEAMNNIGVMYENKVGKLMFDNLMGGRNGHINHIYVFQKNNSIYLKYYGVESDIQKKIGPTSDIAITLEEYFKKNDILDKKDQTMYKNRFFDFLEPTSQNFRLQALDKETIEYFKGLSIEEKKKYGLPMDYLNKMELPENELKEILEYYKKHAIY